MGSGAHTTFVSENYWLRPGDWNGGVGAGWLAHSAICIVGKIWYLLTVKPPLIHCAAILIWLTGGEESVQFTW